jgi:hypothetical protein
MNPEGLINYRPTLTFDPRKTRNNDNSPFNYYKKVQGQVSSDCPQDTFSKKTDSTVWEADYKICYTADDERSFIDFSEKPKSKPGDDFKSAKNFVFNNANQGLARGLQERINDLRLNTEANQQNRNPNLSYVINARSEFSVRSFNANQLALA